jgi:hypothetical protein
MLALILGGAGFLSIDRLRGRRKGEKASRVAEAVTAGV